MPARATAPKPAPVAATFINRGYTPFLGEYNGSTGDDKAPADLREGYIFGPFDRPDEPYYTAPEAAFAFQDNIWPASVPGLVGAFKEYYLALEGFNIRLMRVFATALGLPIDYFRGKYDRHASTVRVLHYPAQDEVPPEGQMRCGAHKDFGSHTILLTDDTPGGLQVHTRDGVWVDAIPPANAFVVNIGDLMMMWTNDRWLSNMHRVVNPPASAGQAAARLSVAYFVHPNRDTVIECIPTCQRDGADARHNPGAGRRSSQEGPGQGHRGGAVGRTRSAAHQHPLGPACAGASAWPLLSMR